MYIAGDAFKCFFYKKEKRLFVIYTNQLNLKYQIMA